MYADQKAENVSKTGPGQEDQEPIMGIPAPHTLLHPEADQVEHIVRSAWSNARLVAE